MSRRGDFVVIMARGLSLRMGQPKGLMRIPGGGGSTFVESIVRLYQAVGLRGVVLTTTDLVLAYSAVVPLDAGFDVVGRAGGGETGRTLWHGAHCAPATTTHLWLHPVDLPLVLPSTVAALRRKSLVKPAVVVRPVRSGRPGHPVIVPLTSLPALVAEGLSACLPARSVITAAAAVGAIAAPETVAVSDNGVEMDFDCPADIAAYTGPWSKGERFGTD